MKKSIKLAFFNKKVGLVLLNSILASYSTNLLAQTQTGKNPTQYGAANNLEPINYGQANNQQILDPNIAMAQTNVPPNGLPHSQPQPYYLEEVKQRNISDDPIESTFNILNMNPDRIRELNRELYNKGRVINEGPVAAPKPINGVIVAHLSPGSSSPVIRLFKNRTSTLIITDMTGQPWPILNYDGLSNEDFSVKRLDNPSPEGYVLSISPKGAFVSGNLVLILKGLPTPLNIEFVSAQKDVDVTTEIRVQAKGPNSQINSIGLPSGIDNQLLSVLQGVAPPSSKELTVSSNAVQAWLTRDGSMYVRTRYKIMSPAFENVTSSPDGTYAYKMIPIPVILYKVADGRFGEFTITGF